jgi:hypothetical protein
MKIVGISGRKQAGKNTAANIFHGIVLENYGLAQDWKIDDKGALQVLTHDAVGNLGWGEFDVARKDSEFAMYAENNMWPYVKLYTFADELKNICVNLFEIPFECAWGTDEQKSTIQKHLLWENMPGVITPELDPSEIVRDYGDVDPTLLGLTVHEPGPMTAREFMQFLGTEVMRKIFEPIWVNATIKKIKAEGTQLAIIADVRFPNEAKAIEDANGLLVRLSRSPLEDAHDSETALNDYPFKHHMDNQNVELHTFIQIARTFFHNNLASNGRPS